MQPFTATPRVDEDETKDLMPHSQVFWESMGSGMLVLCMLAGVRFCATCTHARTCIVFLRLNRGSSEVRTWWFQHVQTAVVRDEIDE